MFVYRECSLFYFSISIIDIVFLFVNNILFKAGPCSNTYTDSPEESVIESVNESKGVFIIITIISFPV